MSQLRSALFLNRPFRLSTLSSPFVSFMLPITALLLFVSDSTLIVSFSQWSLSFVFRNHYSTPNSAWIHIYHLLSRQIVIAGDGAAAYSLGQFEDSLKSYKAPLRWTCFDTVHNPQPVLQSPASTSGVSISSALNRPKGGCSRFSGSNVSPYRRAPRSALIDSTSPIRSCYARYMSTTLTLSPTTKFAIAVLLPLSTRCAGPKSA